MGNPYTSVSITGYNSSPPPDDGTQSAANEITWAKHKTKLGDPLKTGIEAVNNNVNSAIAKVVGGGGITSYGTNSTVQTSDQGKLVRASNSGITITTPDATSVGSPFVFGLINDGGGDITFDGNGSQTINGETSLTVPDRAGCLVYTDGSNWFAAGLSETKRSQLRGRIAGLGLSNNGTDADHDIDIAVGAAMAGDQSAFLELTSALTKQIDATWAVGTNAGGLDTGSVTTDTWYHVWLIRRSDTGVVDALFSTSASSPTMPTNYDQKRRIGAVLTDGSSNIIAFSQEGDEFLWKDPPLDVDNATPGTSANTPTMSTPLGVKVHGLFNVSWTNTDANATLYLSSPDVNDEAPSESAGPLATILGQTWAAGAGIGAGPFRVRTNTSSQIRYRGSGNVQVRIATIGWIDRRGRDD